MNPLITCAIIELRRIVRVRNGRIKMIYARSMTKHRFEAYMKKYIQENSVRRGMTP